VSRYIQSPINYYEIKKYQQDTAEKSKFLAKYGENKISRALRDKIKLRLGAIKPAFTIDTA